MANLDLSGITKLGGYLLQNPGPLDVRTVVPEYSDLTDLATKYYIYPGIIVYAEKEKAHYTYTADGAWEIFSGDQNVNSVSKNIVGGSTTAKANAEVTSNGVYLNHLEDSTVTSSHNIVGSGATTVTSSSTGTITVDTPPTSVTNNAPTLAWGQTAIIGSVGKTNLTVTMPSNPNSNSAHNHAAGAGLTFSDTSRGGTSGTVTYKAKLSSETALTSNTVPVGVDSNGYLVANMSSYAGCEGQIFIVTNTSTGAGTWFTVRKGTSGSSSTNPSYITINY